MIKFYKHKDIDLFKWDECIDSSIQIQRGVGTTTNGYSSFGGNINVLTKAFTEKPYVNSKNAFGSFNSIRNTIEFGTGIINKKWTLDGRLSSICSDGYIERANSNLKSIYLAGGHLGKNSSTKIISFLDLSYSNLNKSLS